MDVVGEIRRVPETKLILFLSVRGTVNFSRMGSTCFVIIIIIIFRLNPPCFVLFIVEKIVFIGSRASLYTGKVKILYLYIWICTCTFPV